MSAHPEDPRTEPLIEVEPAQSYRRCLCCLGPVKWALLLGTRAPYSTTQVAICSSCAATLAPIVAAIAADSPPCKKCFGRFSGDHRCLGEHEDNCDIRTTIDGWDAACSCKRGKP